MVMVEASVSDLRKASENTIVLKHITGLKTEANWPSGTLPTILTRLHEDADQIGPGSAASGPVGLRAGPERPRPVAAGSAEEAQAFPE